jgi:uncharacterized membrane protein YdjX (TVP38/TMEM64 family)
MSDSVRRIIVLSAVAVGLAALAYCGIRWGGPVWRTFRNPEQLQHLVASWGIWAPLGFVGLQLVQVIVAPLPGNVVAIAGGYVFGVGKALSLCMVGVVVGAAVCFLLSRSVGRRLLRLFVPEKTMDQFDEFAARRGPLYVFLLLLVPNPLGDWLYYLAGLTALPLPLFLLQVLIARIPTNLFETFIGSQAARLGSRGYHLAWWQWTVFGALVLVLAIVYFLNRKRIEALFLRFTKYPTE